MALIIRYLFNDIATNIVTNYLEFNFSNWDFPYWQMYIVLSIVNLSFVIIPMIFVHELIHAIVLKYYGGKVKLGFKYFIYAYVQETSNMLLTRNQFITVLLSPVIVLSIIGLVCPYPYIKIFSFLNIIGSTGDLYMALKVIRYNKNCYVADKPYGFDIIDLN
jgi:hypothetical protein